MAETVTMKKDEYEKLPPEGKEHFIECRVCGEMMDCRQLDDVFYHEDHVQRTDIQYAGSKRVK